MPPAILPGDSGAPGITFDPTALPLGRPADLPAVFLYDGGSGYRLLSNVKCVGVRRSVNASPSIARFRYSFDDRTAGPQRFEDVWSRPNGPGVVPPEARLVVVVLRSLGTPVLLFDGYANAPQLDLDDRAEAVTFEAYGVEHRAWDTPLAGAAMRDAHKADSAKAEDQHDTSLPARFNPDGEPNAAPTPDVPADPSEQPDPDNPSTNLYPVFFDVKSKLDPDVRRAWNLGMAARYTIWKGLGKDNAFVKFRLSDGLDDFLRAVKPAGGYDGVDWTKPASIAYEDIVVRDLDVTGDCWPVALEKLLRPHGFGFAFRVGWRIVGDEGEIAGLAPETELQFFRTDNQRGIKDFYLQEAGSGLNPALSNLASARIRRDGHDVITAHTVDGGLGRIEAAFVLAPGFEIDPADANNADTKATFVRKSPEFDDDSETSRKYRVFHADEAGDGHWSFADNAWRDGSPIDLRPLFSPEFRGGDANAKHNYVRRRRPPLRSLLSTDALGEPRDAELWVARYLDYAGKGPIPGLYDPAKGDSVYWQKVAKGGWRLDRDRLGIVVTVNDPDAWEIGLPEDEAPAGNYLAGGVLNLVECLANGGGQTPALVFRLTCVIEGDDNFAAESDPKLDRAAPSRFTVRRRVDARDRHRVDIISGTSPLAADTGLLKITNARDDSPRMRALADARTRATLAPPMGGALSVPRFTAAYRPGDKVRQVRGRGAEFAVGGGMGGNSKVYPTAVGVLWEFDPGQSTTILVDDSRAEALEKPYKMGAVGPAASDRVGRAPEL